MNRLRTTIILAALLATTSSCYKEYTCSCKGRSTPSSPIKNVYSDSYKSTKSLAESTCNDIETIQEAAYFEVTCTLN